MKKLAIGLWAAQVLAAIATLIAAAVQIESILFTGPILSVIGLLHALVTRRLQSWATLLFSLSAPLVSAFVAFLIAIFNWGPEDADGPIVAVLIGYVSLMLPAAIASLLHLVNWRYKPVGSMHLLWRYSLKSLLIVMTAACVLILATRFLVESAPGPTFVFGGFAVVTVTLCGVVLWRFVAYRSLAHSA